MQQKKLGLFSAVAINVGLIVATSCLVSLGSGMGSIGRWFIIPLFLVVILNSFVGLSFSELNQLMPDVDGGTGQYLLAGMGPMASMMGNLSAYVITQILSLTAEITLCGTVITQLFFPNVDNRIISMILLVALFLVNLKGVDLFAKVQDVVVVALVGSMILLGIISFFKLGDPGHLINYKACAPSFKEIGGFKGIMDNMALAFWLLIGVEFIIPEAKNLKNPKRDVLLSMIVALLLLFGVQSLLGSGMTNYVSLKGLAADPNSTPHITFAVNLLGTPGKIWMGVITILAGISTVNTGYASLSKIMQGMGEAGMVPKTFAKTNKNNAAYVGIIFLSAAIGVMVVSGLGTASAVTFLILSGSCFWLFTYCLVHISVLILRKRYPDRPRRFTMKGIPQIIGIAGNIYMIANISTGADRIRIYELCGVLFLVLVTYCAIWIRFVMKVKPFAPMDMDEVNREALNYEQDESPVAVNMPAGVAGQ
ncbi:MAG: APC family permease [Lachnospiraceae bacterium]|nr:APC family permease [Lachnospiraceae bacterium]